MVIPLIVGRQSSIAAVEQALATDSSIMLSCQRLAAVEEPLIGDIYQVGTVAKVLRIMRLPDGKVKVLIQGISRAKIKKTLSSSPYLIIEATAIDLYIRNDETLEAKIRLVREKLMQAVELGKAILPDLLAVIDTITERDKLINIIAVNLGLKFDDAQELLEIEDEIERVDKLISYLNREISILEVQQKIFSDAKSEIDRGQREFFLREQLKVIKRELGDDDIIQSENGEYQKKIRRARMPKDAKSEALKQLARLNKMVQDSAEANVIRGYLDTLAELPWGVKTEDNLDIKNAMKVLDEDHYGLEEVKDRMLDFLALRKLNSNMKSPILCLVGPPGVGKTLLGRSIARAMGRKFFRMSMGGVRDEAEIRGHRRTYIGAMPGKLIQALKTAGINNPIIMLDEIDKLGSDFRGDPAAVLLEVLDSVQNATFTDHYLAVPFDLSNVLFITTANMLDAIPMPLLDRMEVINIPGYTEEEKLIISERYIILRQIADNGLRGLEQMIAKLCRKRGRLIVEGKCESFNITSRNITKYLGHIIYLKEDELKSNEVGIVTGLAWTPVGGEVLFIECARCAGKGNLIITGMLGEVVKESSLAALSFIKTVAQHFNIDDDAFSKYDYHLHIPAGVIPKDGPSAGITMATAILSRLLNKAVKKEIAMTGEITITGKVLPIGGIKEKLLAAKRIGAKTVIVPKKKICKSLMICQTISPTLCILFLLKTILRWRS